MLIAPGRPKTLISESLLAEPIRKRQFVLTVHPARGKQEESARCALHGFGTQFAFCLGFVSWRVACCRRGAKLCTARRRERRSLTGSSCCCRQASRIIGQ